MLQTIFTYEWKQLLRSKGLIVALLIFTAIGFFCLEQGSTVYQYQRISVDSAMAKKIRSYDFVKNIFDTIKHSNIRTSIETPYILERRLQDVVAKNISPLSVLSIGQGDIYTPLISGHFNNEIFKNNFTEFKNPEQLLAGNLDASFFIVFLFPLLLLALTYNLQSADKELGIDSLLYTQAASVDVLFRQRLLFRWLIALLPMFFLTFLSFWLLYSLPGFSYLSFLQWWGVAFLYALFWLVVVALVHRLKLNSLINAISLAGVWVLLLIAIPGLLNTWFNFQNSATNKTEIAEFRDYSAKIWDQSSENKRKYFFANYPQLLKGSAKVDSNLIDVFSSALQILDKEKELHNVIANNASAQMNAEEKSFWINPAGGVMRSFAIIGNTGLEQQIQFEKSVMKYREEKLHYFFENILLQANFTKKDFEKIPKYIEPNKELKFGKYLLPLSLLTLIAIFLSIIKIKNNNQ
jgi:ABC-2 type transport system permease protein